MPNVIEQIKIIFEEPVFAIFLLILLGISLRCSNFFQKSFTISSQKKLIYYEILVKINDQIRESVSSIIVLSSGALLLGSSFIVFDEKFIHREYLLIAWLLFISSIIFGIICRISLINFNIKWLANVEPLEKKMHELPLKEEDFKDIEEKRNKEAEEVYISLNKETFSFEALNIYSFLLAIVFIIIFVLFNFYK